MRKLSLSILAASIAILPAAALAQQGARPGAGHGPRPQAGHSWSRGGNMVRPPMHRPNVQVRHFGNRGMHPGRNFRHQRMNRGFVIHPFWFGSQFHIGNWQMYGFSNPGDGRWVRYYDDAYLIGGDGRVRDHRYGMDWDRYGEEWDSDDGIPAYRGRGDRHDGEDDEHAESHERHERHDGHGGRHEVHTMGGQGHGAAYGGYSGYGAYAYPIVIETITTHGCGCEEVIEEVVEVRQRVQRRRPPVRRAPRPRPPAGERG